MGRLHDRKYKYLPKFDLIKSYDLIAKFAITFELYAEKNQLQ